MIFEIFVSLKLLYFIDEIVVIVHSVRHTLSFRNILLVLAKQITAIFLLTKPFGFKKLNKRKETFNSLAQLLCISLCFNLNLADCRDVLSPDLFSNGSRSSASCSDLLKLPNNNSPSAIVNFSSVKSKARAQ